VDEILAGDSAFAAAAAARLGIGRFQINATATNGVDVSVFADEDGAERCVIMTFDLVLSVRQPPMYMLAD
jgi:hypothetical protein